MYKFVNWFKLFNGVLTFSCYYDWQWTRLARRSWLKAKTRNLINIPYLEVHIFKPGF
jgi:hypothetical protein